MSYLLKAAHSTCGLRGRISNKFVQACLRIEKTLFEPAIAIERTFETDDRLNIPHVTCGSRGRILNGFEQACLRVERPCLQLSQLEPFKELFETDNSSYSVLQSTHILPESPVSEEGKEAREAVELLELKDQVGNAAVAVAILDEAIEGAVELKVLLLSLEGGLEVVLVELLVQKLVFKHPEEEVELEVGIVPWLGLCRDPEYQKTHNHSIVIYVHRMNGLEWCQQCRGTLEKGSTAPRCKSRTNHTL